MMSTFCFLLKPQISVPITMLTYLSYLPFFEDKKEVNNKCWQILNWGTDLFLSPLYRIKFCEGQQLVIKIIIGTSKNVNIIFAAAPILGIRSKLSGWVRCVSEACGTLQKLNVLMFIMNVPYHTILFLTNTYGNLNRRVIC